MSKFIRTYIVANMCVVFTINSLRHKKTDGEGGRTEDGPQHSLGRAEQFALYYDDGDERK